MPTANSSTQAELPLLLLFMPQVDMRVKDDPNLLVNTAVKLSVMRSNKYRVMTFQPDSPVVKRALADRLLMPAELAASPLSQDTQRKLAHLLRAQFALSIVAAKTPDGLKTQSRLDEERGVQNWQTVFITENTTNSAMGRKRLSLKDTAAVAADNITVQMGLPSSLSVSLTQGNKGQGTGNKTKSNDPTPNPRNQTPDPKTAQTASPIEDTGNREQNAEGEKGRKGEGEKNPNPNDLTTQRPNTKIAKPSETGNRTQTQSKIENQKSKIPTPNANETFTAFTTDTATARNEEPVITRNAPPTDASRLDYEAMAMRFRQSGDTTSAISALRRAVNDKPKDVNLRKLLVQAYQDRSLPDAARLEAQRALLLAPEDATLHRLHGETLLAEGNTADATKAFAEAIRLNPSDISAQVALGDALLADNQFTQAVSAYEAAAKNDSRSSLPHRRLARVYVAKAASDPKQYALSLEEIGKARGLIAPADTDTYQEEYLLILKILDSRLNDMLAQLQGSYTAKLQGKQSSAELVRTIVDMKERAEAAADYLEKLPAAGGWNATQARYAQGAAYLIQAMTFFRDWLTKGEPQAEGSYKESQLEAQRELANAQKRLKAVSSK